MSRRRVDAPSGPAPRYYLSQRSPSLPPGMRAHPRYLRQQAYIWGCQARPFTSSLAHKRTHCAVGEGSRRHEYITLAKRVYRVPVPHIAYSSIAAWSSAALTSPRMLRSYTTPSSFFTSYFRPSNLAGEAGKEEEGMEKKRGGEEKKRGGGQFVKMRGMISVPSGHNLTLDWWKPQATASFRKGWSGRSQAHRDQRAACMQFGCHCAREQWDPC